jgi:hypothetical protein
MPPEHKTLLKNTRLEELMASFGCRDEIAPVDSNALGAKVAEVIVRALSPHLLKTKGPANVSQAKQAQLGQASEGGANRFSGV